MYFMNRFNFSFNIGITDMECAWLSFFLEFARLASFDIISVLKKIVVVYLPIRHLFLGGNFFDDVQNCPIFKAAQEGAQHKF